MTGTIQPIILSRFRGPESELSGGAVLIDTDPVRIAGLSSLLAGGERTPQVYVLAPDVARQARELSSRGVVGAGLMQLRRLGAAGLWQVGWLVAPLLPRVYNRDFRAMLLVLLEMELHNLKGIHPKVVFLSAAVTDIALATGNSDLFRELAQHVHKSMGVPLGVETANPNELLAALHDWNSDIQDVLVPAQWWSDGRSSTRRLYVVRN